MENSVIIDHTRTGLRSLSSMALVAGVLGAASPVVDMRLNKKRTSQSDSFSKNTESVWYRLNGVVRQLMACRASEGEAVRSSRRGVTDSKPNTARV